MERNDNDKTNENRQVRTHANIKADGEEEEIASRSYFIGFTNATTEEKSVKRCDAPFFNVKEDEGVEKTHSAINDACTILSFRTILTIHISHYMSEQILTHALE